MKILFISLLLILCASCETKPTSEQRKIITIGGCTYIEVIAGGGNTSVYGITHNGECRNPIHQCNNQLTKPVK